MRFLEAGRPEEVHGWDLVGWLEQRVGARCSSRARPTGPISLTSLHVGPRPSVRSLTSCTPSFGQRRAILEPTPRRDNLKSAAGQGQSGAPAPILVSVTPAKRADFPVVLEGLGQVQAHNTVLVRARVDGQIEKIAFKEGQMVKEGDLLAQIDPRPFQATLDQAIAKKAQDEANLANAKLDLARYATLAKQDFATRQQLDTQNALVLQLTTTIAADAAAIDAARVQLDYTTIRAPISERARSASSTKAIS